MRPLLLLLSRELLTHLVQCPPQPSRNKLHTIITVVRETSKKSKISHERIAPKLTAEAVVFVLHAEPCENVNKMAVQPLGNFWSCNSKARFIKASKQHYPSWNTLWTTFIRLVKGEMVTKTICKRMNRSLRGGHFVIGPLGKLHWLLHRAVQLLSGRWWWWWL